MSVVDKFELEAPKTKAFNQIVADINAPKKTLFVVSEGEDFENAFLSMRNIPTTVSYTHLNRWYQGYSENCCYRTGNVP